MEILSDVPIGRKTTMRIGGSARYFADLRKKEDAKEAWRFSRERNIPLIVLGGGSNTIFDNGTVEALVVQVKPEKVSIEGNCVHIEAGKVLANLINECAKENLDLSPLTGIPGTVGGAIFGNAGQGPKGLWIDHFIVDVTALMDGEWQTLSKADCHFAYRESGFKKRLAPIIWSATLSVPSRPEADVKAEVEALLKKRIETQPHLKTAGSCFKASGGTPAWQLIDAAGLRGWKIGEVEIAQKHANFLLNTGRATFADIVKLIEEAKEKVPHNLDVEMRLYKSDGSLAFD